MLGFPDQSCRGRLSHLSKSASLEVGFLSSASQANTTTPLGMIPFSAGIFGHLDLARLRRQSRVLIGMTRSFYRNSATVSGVPDVSLKYRTRLRFSNS